MEFLGRRAELEVLRRAYGADRSGFIPVYGRRRIGKSALILEFSRSKPNVYFLGKQAPAPIQQKEFMRLCATQLGEPLLAEITPRNWHHILEILTQRLEAQESKWVLAFDEFQWMVQASPELPSILQEFWDTKWSVNDKVVLLLCGSYIGFMEREVLGQKSPLFGRRTAQIHLQPFDYREAAEFHPHESLTNRARIYFLCGGVPQYLKMFKAGRSVEENICSEILDEFSPLYREPDFLLREELRELPKYFAILMSLAKGSVTATESAAVSGVPARSISYYLKQMVDLGYVRKRYPLTEKPPSPRKVRFQLCDPLLRFWFRFLYPHQSSIRQLSPPVALAQLIKPHLPAFYGKCFEQLCQDSLPRYYSQRSVLGFKIGEYWDKRVQIDVVGLRDDGRTDIGECKWGKLESKSAVLKEIDRKCTLYPNDRNATLGRLLFVRDWKGRRPKDVEVLTLEDLYR